MKILSYSFISIVMLCACRTQGSDTTDKQNDTATEDSATEDSDTRLSESSAICPQIRYERSSVEARCDSVLYCPSYSIV